MTIDIPDHILRRLERAQRRVESDLEAIAAKESHGGPLLTNAQSRILQLVPPRGITATELAGHARITKQGLGQMIDVLQDRGMVRRVPDPTDRRSRIIKRTERGQATYEAINAWMEQLHEELADVLGQEAWDALWEALGVLGRHQADPYSPASPSEAPDQQASGSGADNTSNEADNT